ncbi:hypothetical protein H6F93_18685 [Leptolyngbya sp. FACHB-671]|uniref:hypothetical protein n=1 Tax=Leptolyngbya sp. FACHB-671 TaxID=2692812 RepID=UPI0016880B26|nr:hypothetical protein [Leptolyngbya sp. FACHB-671]MBD2069525.1 hypothetical protein [Leptolyngbya sp. FACHB-671]
MEEPDDCTEKVPGQLKKPAINLTGEREMESVNEKTLSIFEFQDVSELNIEKLASIAGGCPPPNPLDEGVREDLNLIRLRSFNVYF